MINPHPPPLLGIRDLQGDPKNNYTTCIKWDVGFRHGESMCRICFFSELRITPKSIDEGQFFYKNFNTKVILR